MQAPKQAARGRADTTFLMWCNVCQQAALRGQPGTFLNPPRASRRHLSTEQSGDAQGNATFPTAARGGDGGYGWRQCDAEGAWDSVSTGGQRKSTALWGRTGLFLSQNQCKENIPVTVILVILELPQFHLPSAYSED